MKRILVEKLPETDRPACPPAAEARHLTQVLRMKAGDVVEALDGRGRAVLAKLRFEGEALWLDFAGEAGATEKTRLPICLEIAMLKADAMGWVIEKAVELGADHLVPIIADHCVVKLKAKAPEEFRDRWQKIADQALKQCGRRERMIVDLPREIAALEPAGAQHLRIFCDEGVRGEAPGLLETLERMERIDSEVRRLSLLIGPEGGWSARERAHLAGAPRTLSVSLGPQVLRAETAALSALAVAAAALRSAALADLRQKT